MSYLRCHLWIPAVLCIFVATTLVSGCGSDNSPGIPNLPNVFTRTNLVSDIPGFSDSAGSTATTDPNLKNPWGVSFTPTSPFWVSDNGTGVATLYDGSGAITPFVVNIPTTSAPTGGAATGQVSNPIAGFLVAPAGPAKFIFATEDGTISAWSSGTNAVLEVDRSSVGAVYKGLAMASTATDTFIYAADFHNGKIDVFDSTWAMAALSGTFTDPNKPAGFAPFNIQNIGGSLYVAFAKQDAAAHDEVAGAGLGFISIFSPDGRFVRRVATGIGAGGNVRELNAPWGIAQAPADFGVFSNSLLIGNFGDGRITAFDPVSHALLGQLRDATGNPVTIPGLWALTFGNGASAGQTNVLFFTAGINDEKDGLFGSIQPATRKPARKPAH